MLLAAAPLPAQDGNEQSWKLDSNNWEQARELLPEQVLRRVQSGDYWFNVKSIDPYYNFGKVLMYMDKDMYRIYRKLVFNRAGEYFYNAMCAYHWARSEEGAFSAVAQNLTVGVNDKTNRAALGPRDSSQYFESGFERSYFSLRTLSHMND